MKILQTEHFVRWLNALRDDSAVMRILARIRRIQLGNPGDAKGVGEGVMEMRINYGPGYRVYFTLRGQEIVILLAGGTKKGQSADIELAKALAKNI